MQILKDKQCIPCEGGVPPLEGIRKIELLKQLSDKWKLSEDKKRLFCIYGTNDFKQGMYLAQKIADLADDQWHHPELLISFKFIEITIWTHKINDLVESDYIFAAKVDVLLD